MMDTHTDQPAALYPEWILYVNVTEKQKKLPYEWVDNAIELIDLSFTFTSYCDPINPSHPYHYPEKLKGPGSE